MEEWPTDFFAAKKCRKSLYLQRGFTVDEADDDSSHNYVSDDDGDDDPDDSISDDFGDDLRAGGEYNISVIFVQA